MKTDSDFHAVFLDSIVGDVAEELLLSSVVELRSRNVHPCGICSWNAERINADGGDLIDTGRVDERSVVLVHYLRAARSQLLAQIPFIRGGDRDGLFCLSLEARRRVGDITQAVPVILVAT